MFGLRSSKSVVLRREAIFKASSLSRSLSAKIYKSSLDAVQDIPNGATVLFGGFGLCGIPENLIEAIKVKGTKDMIAVSNDAGTADFGLGILFNNGQISKLYASYVGENKNIAKLFAAGKLELALTPQGTLAEKLRAAGAGIPAFYTPTGVGTVVQEGKFPMKYDSEGKVEKYSEPKETRVFDGKKYVLEQSLKGDFACVKAWKADTAGNLIFHSTARNFNPEMCKAAKITIAEVEEIVEAGKLDPDEIHVPGVFVQRVVLGEKFEKRISKLTLAADPNAPATTAAAKKENVGDEQLVVRNKIAKRAAQEFKDGMYINLGIGIPTVTSNYIPKGMNVVLQSENGLMGTGPYPVPGKQDPDLINAGKETITYIPGSAIVSSSESFGMIRGHHIDLTILGALEVSGNGDLASWIVPGSAVKGMGGAMDLVSGCDKVIVTMQHTDKNGNPKILERCKLPLTGKAVIDMIVTELAVFKVDRLHGGLLLTEVAEGFTVEDIRRKTEAAFSVAENVKTF